MSGPFTFLFISVVYLNETELQRKIDSSELFMERGASFVS